MWTMPEGRNQSCRVPTRIPNLIAKSIFQLSTQYYIYLVFSPYIITMQQESCMGFPLMPDISIIGVFLDGPRTWSRVHTTQCRMKPTSSISSIFSDCCYISKYILTSFPNIILPSCMARLMLRETGSGRTEGRTLHYLLALGQIYIDQCEKKMHFYQYRMSNKQ